MQHSALSTQHSALGTSARRVIVNADDFGLSPAVNHGIVELCQAGLITSASLLMNLPATADALARTAGLPLDIGVHLNLTVGWPLAKDVPSLVGAGGAFQGVSLVLRRLALGRLNLAEVEREWAAQIEAFLATGRPLAHLDSHLHLHAYPWLSGVALRLAQRYRIGAIRLQGHGLIARQAVPLLPGRLAATWRLPSARAVQAAQILSSDHLLMLTAMWPRLSVPRMRNVLRFLPAGLTELITHPGYVDAELRRLDRLHWQRERELRLLRSEAWQALLADSGLQLTTYAREVERRRETSEQ